MMLIPAGVKVHLALGYTYLRKGIDGLGHLRQPRRQGSQDRHPGVAFRRARRGEDPGRGRPRLAAVFPRHSVRKEISDELRCYG
jgi:hypothetical protein